MGVGGPGAHQGEIAGRSVKRRKGWREGTCRAPGRCAANRASGRHELAGVAVAETSSGQDYLFGYTLNQPLVGAKMPLWTLAAGGAQSCGCNEIPDVGEIGSGYCCRPSLARTVRRSPSPVPCHACIPSPAQGLRIRLGDCPAWRRALTSCGSHSQYHPIGW